MLFSFFHSRKKQRSKKAGFTLAELLIALGILGIIAAFTIPKVLVAQQDQKYNAAAKEAAGMVADAYRQWLTANGGPSSSFEFGFLTPYMNYISIDTSGSIDYEYGNTTIACITGGWNRCMRLHNGGIIRYGTNGNTMNGTQTTNAIWFHFDPDGRITDGTTNGPGKAVAFWIYTNGRVVTWKDMTPNTCFSSGCYNPISTDPPWFSW